MSKTKIGFIVVIIVIALAILWQLGAFSSFFARESYQAVFLTNGQVYFGKVNPQDEDNQYVTLRDIYYLQVQRTIQPIDQSAPPVQNLALIKLGEELHRPQDEMRVNRDQILFIEDLRDDSQIVTAIRNFKASSAPPPPPVQ